MGRKFQIDPEEFDNKKKLSKVEEVNEKPTTELNDVSEITVENVIQKCVEEVPKIVENIKSEVEQPSTELIIAESGTVNTAEYKSNGYVQIKVQRKPKAESKTLRKQVVLRPSLALKVENILEKQYDGMSFNDLVNQLLEGWAQEASVIEQQ